MRNDYVVYIHKNIYKLTIVIFDRWEELEGSIPQDEMDTEANAITISAYGASLVAVNSRRGSSIVHEAEHIKYLICACKVIYLLYCMGVKFYITLHCLIIS